MNRINSRVAAHSRAGIRSPAAAVHNSSDNHMPGPALVRKRPGLDEGAMTFPKAAATRIGQEERAIPIHPIRLPGMSRLLIEIAARGYEFQPAARSDNRIF